MRRLQEAGAPWQDPVRRVQAGPLSCARLEMVLGLSAVCSVCPTARAPPQLPWLKYDQAKQAYDEEKAKLKQASAS